VLPPAFVFWQADRASDAGAAAAARYRLTAFPAILVVDPATGAAMRAWTGFVPPARLADGLAPFLDARFDEPAAASLATRRAPRGGGGGGTPSSRGARAEEDALAAALAASVAEAGQAAAAAAPPPPPAPPAEAATTTAATDRDIPALQAAAAARLPAEPPTGGVRVRVRTAGGAITRSFPPTATLATVADAAIAADAGAAARPFHLREGIPGAPPLDPAATLAAALPNGGMLVLHYTD
jgi:hypothetical protein